MSHNDLLRSPNHARRLTALIALTAHYFVASALQKKRTYQAAEKLGFVSGHDFSRAIND
jgi:hypothetical protein